MKKSNVIILLGGLAGGIWAYTIDGDPTYMQQNIREAGWAAVCTKTENLEDRIWLACRWGDGGKDSGPVWVLDESSDKTTWIAANGTALTFLDRINRVAPDWEETAIAKMRPSTQEDNLPNFVPWDHLN